MNAKHKAEVVLEPAAQEFVTATGEPPYLFKLGPEAGRKTVDEVQSGEGVVKPDVDEEWVTIAGVPTGEVKARIVKARGARQNLPVILYVHGAGWVFGNAR